MQIIATYPPPFGAIAAGTVILAGLMNVRKILSTEIPKMPGVSGGSSGGGGGAPAITAPTIPSVQVPQTVAAGNLNPTSQIAEGLSRANSKPIQAYVVSTQISSQQALDRRTNSAATM